MHAFEGTLTTLVCLGAASLQMTCIDRSDCIVTSELRTDTNDAFAFFKFVAALIRNGYLQSGDVFIVDNARIHTAEFILQSLATMVAAVGVSMVFLPKYSPELNPCESVFGQVKSYLRYRRGLAPFALEV
jgi:hypothetical protein